jgi:POT family proton-dependent oligopeptide transporter
MQLPAPVVVTTLSFAQRSLAFLKIRPALLGLASTELFERFAVAGLKSLLTLVLVNYIVGANEGAVFGLASVRSGLESMFGPLSDVGLASQIYGLSSALLYLSVPLCGVLGDLVIGRRLSVLIGGVLMIAGLLMVAGTWLALPGLFVFALGAGGLKGNLAAQVGGLFQDDHERRSGYALYLGFLNGGIIIGPLVCGAVAAAFGWTYGVLAAGGGVLVGLMIYSSALRGSATHDSQQTRRSRAMPAAQVQSARVVPLLTVAILAVFLCFAAYEQISNLVLVWASRHVNLNFSGLALPPGWIVALDGLLTMLLIVATEWIFRIARRRGREIDEIARIIVGCACCAAGYAVLALAATQASDAPITLLWIFAFVVLVDLGIVLVWPAGLSLISSRAPPTLVGLLVGVFYLHGFFANLWVGAAGAFYEGMEQSLFWLIHAGIASSGAVLLLVASGPLSRLARAPQAMTTSA